MGKESLWQKIRQAIGSCAWRVFLWSNKITQEKYWNEIYEQERDMRKKYHIDLNLSANKEKAQTCDNCGNRIRTDNPYVYNCPIGYCWKGSEWKPIEDGIVEKM